MSENWVPAFAGDATVGCKIRFERAEITRTPDGPVIEYVWIEGLVSEIETFRNLGSIARRMVISGNEYRVGANFHVWISVDRALV